MKTVLLAFLCLLTSTGSAQELSTETISEIEAFGKKQLIHVKEFQMKKYYASFSEDYLLLFLGETIDMKERIKWGKKQKRTYKKDPNAITSPRMRKLYGMTSEDFYADFNTYIFTQDAIANGYVNASDLIKKTMLLFSKSFNPALVFTKDRYLMVMLSKPSADGKHSKHRDYMILQVIEKKDTKWQVYASYF
ncbi:hypothetical protein [Cellulophaga sp. Z1A5H]|uniref:hypothetical protein n=1 Tax=Cellulophaga sp. Z1A5H TaxID=2687291 RepID=UPI0013FD5634|nr:hypothetical protein [Cellulophaga sp. Z1A5H]